MVYTVLRDITQLVQINPRAISRPKLKPSKLLNSFKFFFNLCDFLYKNTQFLNDVILKRKVFKETKPF